MIRAALITAFLAIAPAQAGDIASVMSRYAGMHEVRNRAAIKRMIGVDPRRTPWCGAMLTFAAKKAGKRIPSGSFKASSWTRYGKPVKRSNARHGDIAVVRGGRHVIAFTHWKGGKACGWSGNSSNRVQATCYGGVVAVRR